ncbi:MAG TPA: RNA methyltransferase [Burkholderiales bacterium]|nr:RNA methyltransferase [Burkholderiales bacterium]
MERISSRQNAHFKLARKLVESSRERSKAGRVVLDGTRLIGSYASQFGLDEVEILVSEDGSHQEQIQQIAARATKRVYVFDNSLFAEISNVESPEGITAIAPIPNVPPRRPDDFRILIDGVQDPGNLGGLLRTAAAAGATSALLTKECADAWSPKSLRGGMGAQFVLPLHEDADARSALADFRGSIIATSPRATKSIYEIDLTNPLVMIFGSEGRGLTGEVQQLATELVYLPMVQGIESLNVAAAAAVCCFERLRQITSKKR